MMDPKTEETALIRACKIGQLNSVRSLVENCRVVNESTVVLYENSRQGDCIGSPLHAAVMSGDAELVRFLVKECDADVDAVTTKRTASKIKLSIRTVFKKLVPKTKKYKIYKVFLKCGNTPLHYATYYLKGQKLNDTVAVLIENGADMLIRNSADRFPWELSTDSAAALQFMNSHKEKCSNLRAFKEKLFAACGTGSAKDLKIAKNELIDSKGMRNCVASLVNSTDHRWGDSVDCCLWIWPFEPSRVPPRRLPSRLQSTGYIHVRYSRSFIDSYVNGTPDLHTSPCGRDDWQREFDRIARREM